MRRGARGTRDTGCAGDRNVQGGQVEDSDHPKGNLHVQKSMPRATGEAAHRAMYSPDEVTTLLKTSPAYVTREINRDPLLPARIEQGSRSMPEDSQAWMDNCVSAWRWNYEQRYGPSPERLQRAPACVQTCVAIPRAWRRSNLGKSWSGERRRNRVW